MSKYLTTHQIAGLIGVSERTVANWIDRGHLAAFRTPGGHRRVSPQGLREFLKVRRIPVPAELTEVVRVLIVEDEPAVAATLRTQLERAVRPYEIVTIADGVSALIQIGNWKPHVVLLDILMPGMDGLEVCRKIKSNSHLGETQVIFVTAWREMEPETVKRDTGAFDVLLKPVDGEAVRHAVAAALGARNSIPA